MNLSLLRKVIMRILREVARFCEGPLLDCASNVEYMDEYLGYPEG